LDGEDNKCRVFVKITLGNCPLGRLRKKWEGNIKMNIREVCNKDEILIRQSPFRAFGISGIVPSCCTTTGLVT
jgi:hypothetical protein